MVSELHHLFKIWQKKKYCDNTSWKYFLQCNGAWTRSNITGL